MAEVINKKTQFHQKEKTGITKEDIQEILKGNSEKLIFIAENFVKNNLQKQSTASIRKVFSEVKGMKKYDKYRLDLLRPKLAYVSRRHSGLKPLTDLLDFAIKEVREESFKYFQDFFEAILAYFYRYGKE